MKTTAPFPSKLLFVAVLGLASWLPAPRVGAQDCASLPPVPTAATTATQDRDRMLCIQGITIPTLPPTPQDPNQSRERLPRNPAAAGRQLDGSSRPYRRADGVRPVAHLRQLQLPPPSRYRALGGAMAPFGDYGPESTPRYTDIELLKMKDGAPVVSPEDWWTKRRPEIFELVQKELTAARGTRASGPRSPGRSVR